MSVITLGLYRCNMACIFLERPCKHQLLNDK
jgi:hypothetical protein